MLTTDIIRNQLKRLKLTALSTHLDQLIQQAECNQISYLELVKQLLETEIQHRMAKDQQRRTKQAQLPLGHNLDLYDFSHHNGLDKKQLQQLRELHWLEQNFNLILMGPSGTGKTYIAAGLCFDAVQKGYKAYFKSMQELLEILKMKEVTRKAAIEYKRLLNAHLLIIDDIMILPVNQPQAVALFNLVNLLHEKTSLIITTNKSPKQWAEVLNDEVLATALLDRLLYRCEIVKLHGESFRLKNRKTIFEPCG